MNALRQLHNRAKRELITEWVRPGSKVLDCGCGRGGDIHKWKSVQAHVFAIDPDEASLREAEQRAHDSHVGIWFLGPGTIIEAQASGPYDVICYNFSLQYIFEDAVTYRTSLKALVASLAPGGFLIGVAPDKARAEALTGPKGHFRDALGNEVSLPMGSERLHVRLADGPFYAAGGRSEPLLDSLRLIQDLDRLGISLVSWEPMIPIPNGLVSDLYSKFVFRKKNKSV